VVGKVLTGVVVVDGDELGDVAVPRGCELPESGMVLITKPPEFWPTQQAEGRMGSVGTPGIGPAGTPGLGRVPVWE